MPALPRRWPAAAVPLLLLVPAGLVAPPPALAEPPGAHRPPVPGAVLDPFRPPGHAYGPGNRGLDLAAEPGTPVVASAGGEVTFAGRIGAAVHVVVLHADGLRTSYSFLAGTAVGRGDRVAAGQVVGTAAGPVHFGVRAGERYLDPALLLAGGPPEVHLVPLELRSPQSEAQERRGVLDSLGGAFGRIAGAGQDATAWLFDNGRDGATELLRLGAAAAGVPAVATDVVRAFSRHRRLQEAQEGCTPADRPLPHPPPERRIAVLVSGLGSTSEAAAVTRVRTDPLGYPPADVAFFSYAGGRAPGHGELAGVPVRTFDADDSGGDLRRSSARLRELLQDIRAAHPGVPVDLIAHSQGGVVVRGALGEPGDGYDPSLPPIGQVVTLGSPHRGAPAADDLWLWDRSPASLQLDDEADHIEALAGRDPPPADGVTSIAASGDMVVPGPASDLPGATNVVIPLSGPSAHDQLPGSDAAHREMALALAGAGPTCRSADELGLLALEGEGWGAAQQVADVAVDVLVPGP